MYRFLSIFLMVLGVISCKPRFEAEITPAEIEEHIAYLASDDLKGRYPGTHEDQLASDYIIGAFKHAGLVLYHKTGLQGFDIVTDIELGEGNRFSYNESVLEPGTDYIPLSFSDNGSVESELVFAGYGFRVNQEQIRRDDYIGIDATGKWVIILRGVPGEQETSSPYVNFSEDRGKALVASDMGAAGVIFVSGVRYDPKDGLEELKGKQHILSIPVIQITRREADGILSSGGFNTIEALDALITEQGSPASFSTGLTMDISVDLRPKTVETENTIAFLKGADPGLRDQYVIVGAHHDHLGMGGPGTTSRVPDTVAVHYGADDNASGVAGVIEISEYMVSRSPSRSMVFTTFGAEEMGLVGSKYLTENPPVDLSMVQAMINLDMVGRLNEERQLQIGGTGTSPGLKELLDSLNRGFGFNLKFSNEGYGPSDHSSFYAKDVPVLFFSTGAHPEYHTPADNLSSINLEGEAQVLRYVADVVEALANEKDKITFTEAGPKVKGSSRGRRGGITLGLMPDVTYEGNEGMPVMFVTEGKPAAVGGIQKGDVIMAIEGKTVGNVYDYMNRLDQLKEGMDIVVTVRRGGDRLDLLVRL
jgi:aminopeptidase YwaD